MDPIQTDLHSEADTLATRATRLLLELAFGGVRALLRDVRALQKNVRLWLIAIALCFPALPPAAPRGKISRTGGTRKSGTSRRPSERLGLRLLTGSVEIQSREPPAAGRDPNAPARTKADRENSLFATLAGLVLQLHDLQCTIADPRAALTQLARKFRLQRPATASAQTSPDAAYTPSTDDFETKPGHDPSAFGLPRPDT